MGWTPESLDPGPLIVWSLAAWIGRSRPADRGPGLDVVDRRLVELVDDEAPFFVAGLKPRMSGSIREQDCGKFALLDAATDTELAKRLGSFHKSQSRR